MMVSLWHGDLWDGENLRFPVIIAYSSGPFPFNRLTYAASLIRVLSHWRHQRWSPVVSLLTSPACWLIEIYTVW